MSVSIYPSLSLCLSLSLSVCLSHTAMCYNRSSLANSRSSGKARRRTQAAVAQVSALCEPRCLSSRLGVRSVPSLSECFVPFRRTGRKRYDEDEMQNL